MLFSLRILLNFVFFFIFLQVQVLNLISILIGHVSEVIPYANKLVQFFQKVCISFCLHLYLYPFPLLLLIGAHLW